MSSVAIYYHPEAYTTSSPKLMGRNAAGESFLRGLIMHSKLDEYWLQVEKKEYAQHFAMTAKSLNKNLPLKVVTKNNLITLSQPGVVYYPGPNLGKQAWHRAAYGHGAWSLCGITHTTSSANAMDSLVQLITGPVQAWDAVICTSQAVKHNVERLLQAQADYLVHRLGVQKLVLPLLPVIPLGIHTQDFVFTSAQKASARKAIKADKNTIVVTFMGRLSFHAKAHPLAMYQALEKAAGKLVKGEKQKIVLVECGWHANDAIAKAYGNAAQLACPSVRVAYLDGRNVENRITAWASADVFCSLSDNIQETFGIAPIEAMATGIPVVVSNWDGYKDTVRDGIDGFLIPTTMPGPGLGVELALRHALEIDTYDMYCGHTSALISVDVGATAIALSKLFESSELRQRMGSAGQARAREIYDWSVIIPQYEALWEQQAEIRMTQQGALKPLIYPWPARMDPFAAFIGYPSQSFTSETKLNLVDLNYKHAADRLAQYRQLAMVNFATLVLPSEDECQTILAKLSRETTSAADLIKSLPHERQVFIFRALTWLLKLGIVKIVI